MGTIDAVRPTVPYSYTRLEDHAVNCWHEL